MTIKKINWNFSEIKARAPLRIGLAGGGTDLPIFSEQYGGAVLNATIDKFVYAIIKKSDEETTFKSIDLDIEIRTSSIDDIKLDGILDLHKAVYLYIMINYCGGDFIPLQLISLSESPIGSGMGSSSTLTVSLIKAFVELLNLPLDNYEIAKLAFKIEREDCKLKGGMQDYYSATFGGINYIEFEKNKNVVVHPLKLEKSIINELQSRILLFYSGISRNSSEIISIQHNEIKNTNPTTMESMLKIKEEVFLMKNYLLTGEIDHIATSFNSGWESKKRSAPIISNTYLDEIYSKGIEAGAVAGKVSGAGGGGFMIFIVPVLKRKKVADILMENFDGFILDCNFSENGCESWKI